MVPIVIDLRKFLDDILDIIEVVSSLLKSYDPKHVAREAEEIAD